MASADSDDLGDKGRMHGDDNIDICVLRCDFDTLVVLGQEGHILQCLTDTERQHDYTDGKALISKGVDFVTEAVKEDEHNHLDDAFSLYKQGIKLFLVAFKYSDFREKMKVLLREKTRTYLVRAEHIKIHLDKDSNTPCSVCLEQKKGRADMDRYFEGFIIQESEKRKFDDFIGNGEAKVKLQEKIILPFKFPQLFTGSRRPHFSMVLVGHPGSGKTLLLSCVASELPEVTFLRLSVFELLSPSYNVMETSVKPAERNVKELFNFAIKKEPCVLCIEDIDRLEDVPTNQDKEQGFRQMRTELLVQYHRVMNDLKDKKVAIVFQTQRPWALSATLRRRMDSRVLIDLPTRDDRVKILKSNLRGVRHSLTEKDFNKLGEKTLSVGGYRCTQADIVILCRDAMMQPIRRIQKATYFKQVVHPETGVKGYWTPCESHEDCAVRKNWMDIQAETLLESALGMADVMQCLEWFRGTVDPDVETDMQQWIQDFT